MSAGEVINGYRLLTDFTPAGGGQCVWAFAEKGGAEYFIKRYLKPVYPVDGAPGSEAVKERKRRDCARFEEWHRTVWHRLRPLTSAGGNLVVTSEFFREGSHYYKTTVKVDVSSAGPADVARLPTADLIRVMLTVVNSLRILHRHELVHGDVKTGNILVKQTEAGKHTTKLIDFDDCFPNASPPEPEQLVVDFAYCGPETLAYLNEEGPAGALTTKGDIFALGVVFCEYLTGGKPALRDGFTYPGQAVGSGHVLTVPVFGPNAPLAQLTARMLAADPGVRPSCEELHQSLKVIQRYANRGDLTPPPPPVPVPSPPSDPEPSGRLRGSLLTQMRAEAPEPPEEVTPGGFLRGTLAPKSRPPED